MEKFMRRVVRHGEPACWDWNGCHNSRGYGITYRNGKQVLAHRAVYEMERGPIPHGLTIDHLCRNKGCVNPAHMEPVTQAENNRRGKAAITHCPSGHAYTPKNFGRKGINKTRFCRACKQARDRAAYAANAEKMRRRSRERYWKRKEAV